MMLSLTLIYIVILHCEFKSLEQIHIRGHQKLNSSLMHDLGEWTRNISLWVQLGPDTLTGSAGADALLNGLEVSKLNRNGKLAYKRKYENIPEKSTSKDLIMWVGIRVSIASIIILADLVMLIIWLCSKDDIKKSSPGRRPLFLHAAVVTNTLLVRNQYNIKIQKAFYCTRD